MYGMLKTSPVIQNIYTGNISKLQIN